MIPLRMAVVNATFPLKKQLEEVKRAMRFRTAAEVAPYVHFDGFEVRRRVILPDGDSFYLGDVTPSTDDSGLALTSLSVGETEDDLQDTYEVVINDDDGDELDDNLAVGLDLVEVSPNADPPVAKFLDVGKYKYEAQKKANLARKSQKTQEIKEIKMRPNIDDHDYDTKMKKVVEFIEEGDKVKVTMRFRGRELSHGQLGMAVLQRVAEQVNEVAKVEAYPRMEGRQMLMVLAPK